MKLAITGSRNLSVENLEKHQPHGIDEIVSGGARGIDSCAEKYAINNNIKFTVFLPEYEIDNCRKQGKHIKIFVCKTTE